MTRYFLGDANEETKVLPEQFIFCEGVKAMTDEGNVLCDDLWGEEPKNAEPNLKDVDECFWRRDVGALTSEGSCTLRLSIAVNFSSLAFRSRQLSELFLGISFLE